MNARMRLACTCVVRPPIHRSAVGNNGVSKYAIYLDEVEDRSEFDPACPFHGKDGSMVVRFPAGDANEKEQP